MKSSLEHSHHWLSLSGKEHWDHLHRRKSYRLGTKRDQMLHRGPRRKQLQTYLAKLSLYISVQLAIWLIKIKKKSLISRNDSICSFLFYFLLLFYFPFAFLFYLECVCVCMCVCVCVCVPSKQTEGQQAELDCEKADIYPNTHTHTHTHTCIQCIPWKWKGWL